MKVELTPKQKSALDLSRHTAIIANAGSGKTAVLVERYLKVLIENKNSHPRNIAAITFTDASARDLKKKISEELLTRIKDTDNDKLRNRLIEIRRQLSNANISTIHSFCIQLLRMYSTEAKVDASFTILTSPEDQLLREECVQSTFYRILKVAYSNEDSPEAKLLPAFRLFGRRKIETLMHSFLGSSYKMNSLINSVYSNDDSVILSFWENEIVSVVKDEILSKVNISFFVRLLQEKTKEGKFRQKAEDALSSYLAAKTEIDKLKCYKALIGAFYTKEFTLTRNIFPQEIKDLHNADAEQAVSPYITYCDFIDSILDSSSQSARQYLEYIKQIIDVYSRVLESYREQKITHSFLDYDDVIEYALRLVQIPDIQVELVKRFSHILIDEYQDTDEAQYAIAKALTGNFKDSNKLTVVGDPKQSIYSFRNANLNLYLSTIKEISTSHSDNTPVELSETFRMLSHPLAFINKVSAHLFANNDSVHSDFKFSPLVEGRNATKEGSIELMLPPLDSEPKNYQDVESKENEDVINAEEVDLIALKINNIILGNNEKYTLGKELPEYRDIAILLRSRTHQSELESALRKHNIPFLTSGGNGFYTKPEIIDINNYLKFLVNPNDDIALAGILRSPYFGLSDIDLYRLAPEKNSVLNLWQRFLLYSHEKDYSIRAYEQISENLQLVGRVSTQFLLQKIITESGILGILSSLSDCDQKIANIEKYQRFALAFTKEGYSGTFDFIERMSLLMERDEMEAQAQPQNDLNAVHLMTIHNAKGLEFPIVFIPYLHTKILSTDARRIWNTLDKEFGIGLDLPEQISKLPITELIKLRAKEKATEEEKRIFYVAMTRARDHLILSASAPKKNFNKTRMGWVLESLGIESEEALSVGSFNFSSSIERYRTGEENSTDVINITIPFYHEKKDIPQSTELVVGSKKVVEEAFFLLEDIQPSESIGRYSPSQILTYQECPTKYYLRYQLGLPEEERLPYFNEADIFAENVQGSLFGQIVHKVLERANGFIIGDFYDEKLLEETIDLASKDLHLPDSSKSKYSKRVIADVMNVLSSPIGKEALHAQEFQMEIPIRVKIRGGQILSGIIDRLFLDAQGMWNILDYKTDLWENPAKKTRYEFQMQFYAYLVSRLYSQDIVKAHVLYTHSGNSLSFTFAQKEFSDIGLKLESFVKQIRAQRKFKSLEEIERNISHCPECPYFDKEGQICIAGNGTESIPLQTELLFVQ
jgi:ATP-dependent helicase/nuclease subunit A